MRLKLLMIAMLLLPPTAAAGPKLYVFDCGLIQVESVEIFNLKEDETSVCELFVPRYLIRHDKGLLLWDGGLPASAAEAEGKVKLEGGTMSYDRYLVDQLAEMGIKPADVTHAAFSHLHFDHAGAANSFTQSNILMQKTEWDAAFGKSEGYVDATLFDKLKDAKRTLRRPPNFNFDAEMTLESMDKVEALLATSGATLWIEHDEALAEPLKKAPLFYD